MVMKKLLFNLTLMMGFPLFIRRCCDSEWGYFFDIEHRIMKKLKFILILLVAILLVGCKEGEDTDVDPLTNHDMKGRVTEKESGNAVQGIGLQFKDCKPCFSKPCEIEDFGGTTTAVDGSFSHSYYGKRCVRLYIETPWDTIVHADGSIGFYPRYIEYELFGYTEQCESSYLYDPEKEFLDIKLIKYVREP